MRPTRDNISVLKRELRQPRFQSYHLCKPSMILWDGCMAWCGVAPACVVLVAARVHTCAHAHTDVCALCLRLQISATWCRRCTCRIWARPTRPENWSKACRRAIIRRFCALRNCYYLLGASSMLTCLATQPKHRLCTLQEFYGDFVALDTHHFIVPVAGADILINPRAAVQSGAPSECAVGA